MEYILLIIGFILIIKASDVLVDSASSIAIKCKIPKTLIALTVVAFGTCAPELAISFQSISGNSGSMALANVVGSCIINILLIIGVAAFINPIRVKNATIKKELPILLIITTGFVMLVMGSMFWPFRNNILSRVDGLLLLLLFSIFVYYIVNIVKKRKQKRKKK